MTTKRVPDPREVPSPETSLELPFGTATVIAHSATSVHVRSPRENGAPSYWQVNHVNYIGDAHLVRQDDGWRARDWNSVYLHRPVAGRDPTDAAVRIVREGVLAAVTAWAETPAGMSLLETAAVSDRKEAVNRLREEAEALRKRAAEWLALARRVAAGSVSPDEGRSALNARR